MSRSLEERFCDFVYEQRLWEKGDRVVAAVSGGPDSMALLSCLGFTLNPSGSLVCCTVNHHLRKEAAEEAAYVESICRAWGIPFRCVDVDVKGEAARTGESIETCARRLRYGALWKVAKEEGATLLATAHHKDDQAETVLAHLIRGSGLAGLAAMRPRRGRLIRPLLFAEKEDILQYLKRQHIAFCHDASNDIPDVMRNRIRLSLLPMLKTYNEGMTDALCRLADTAAADEEALEDMTGKAFAAMTEKGKEGLSLDLSLFRKENEAIRRRLIRKVWASFPGEPVPDFEGTCRVEALLMKGETGKCTSEAGIMGEISYGKAFFYPGDTRRGRASSANEAPRWTMTKTFLSAPPERLEKNQCLLDADEAGEVILRTREEGDRFCPAGMEGSKSLSRAMQDFHIPAAERDTWPVAAHTHHIYWVVGKGKSRLSRPGIHTKHYLLLTVRREP